jgi:WD40 repeat protein
VLYLGRCKLWDTTSGKLLGLLDGSGEILKAVFSPDSSKVFAAGTGWGTTYMGRNALGTTGHVQFDLRVLKFFKIGEHGKLDFVVSNISGRQTQPSRRHSLTASTG